MGVYNFLKSKLGKATMVGTTAATGTAANFIVADSIKEDMKVSAIKEGLANLGVDPNSITSQESYQLLEELKFIVDSGTAPKIYVDVYNTIMDGINKVDITSHYQPQTITGTCAVAAVTAIAWVALYLISKRKANKVAKVKVEDIK